MIDKKDECLSGIQAAAFLGVKSSTLYAYASRGLIESIPAKSGRERLYRLTDLVKLRQSVRGVKPASDEEVPTWTGPVIKSAITEIRDNGHRYRGQSAISLARKQHSFESVAELLWNSGGTVSDWRSVEPIERPKFIKNFVLPEVDFLDTMKLLLAAIEIADPIERKLSRSDLYATSRKLILTMVAAANPSATKHHFDHTGNSKFPLAQSMLEILSQSHSQEKAAMINSALVLCADHELNASALTARIAASCDASLYSCISGAAATFSGGLHGLASRRVEQLVTDSLKFVSANAWLKSYLKYSDTIPGFGMKLYKHGDPRGKFLLEAALSMSKKNVHLNRIAEIVDLVEDQLGLKPNVDIGLTALVAALSLPAGSSSIIFAISRTAGWIAHAAEQRYYGGVIRPRAKYIGKTQPL